MFWRYFCGSLWCSLCCPLLLGFLVSISLSVRGPLLSPDSMSLSTAHSPLLSRTILLSPWATTANYLCPSQSLLKLALLTLTSFLLTIPSITHSLLIVIPVPSYTTLFHSVITIHFKEFPRSDHLLCSFQAFYLYHPQPVLNLRRKALIHHFAFFMLLSLISLLVLDHWKYLLI